nr:DUF6049 family protein [Flaviflexus huanghaiensis]
MAAVSVAAIFGFAPPAAAQSSDAIDIEITDIAAVHRPGESVPVSVTVTNPGSRLRDVPLDLTVQASVPLYRATLSSWISDDSMSAQMLTLDRRTVDVPTGETTFDIDIPAEVLTWGNTSVSWGPRGFQASVSVDDETIIDRTILTTEPSFELEPMTFTTILPLTVSADELDEVPSSRQRYEESVAALREGTLDPEGELPDPIGDAIQSATERVVDDIGALTSPGITLALDSSFAASDYGTLDATADPLRAFASGDGHELVLLPALDADLAGWAKTGADEFFKPHVEQVERTRADLDERDVPARTDLLVAPGPLTDEVAELGAANGADVLALENTDVPPIEPLNWTPSAHAVIDETPAIVADAELSRLLAGEGSMSDLDRRQTLVALTAAHYRERPNDHRPLAFMLPRGADAAEVNDVLEILDGAAWLEGGTASDIEELPLDPFDRAGLASADPVSGSRLEQAVASIREAEIFIATIGDLTVRPDMFRDAVAATVQVAGSAALTPQDLDSRVEELETLAASLSAQLAVQPSSTVNLISRASEFPVHVTSGLPVPISVAVEMRSDDRRLEFEPVSTVLQPNTTKTVGVPVRAIGSGNISTRVDIVGPVGQVIGTGTEINIRVRADWENMGTAIIAGAFLIILIVGVVRSARRGTRTPPVSEPGALESEE